MKRSKQTHGDMQDKAQGSMHVDAKENRKEKEGFPSESTNLRGTLASKATCLCKSNPDFERIRLDVKKELDSAVRAILEKRRELILTLGRAIKRYAKGAIQTHDICIAIKFFLADEIKADLISSRDIERHCPDEWKNKRRPKITDQKKQPNPEGEGRNDNLSYSSSIPAVDSQPRRVAVVLGDGQFTVEDEHQNDTTAERNGEDQSGTANENCSHKDETKRLASEKAAEVKRLRAETEIKNVEIEGLKRENDGLRQKLAEYQMPLKGSSRNDDVLAAAKPLKRGSSRATSGVMQENFTARTTIEYKGTMIPLIAEVIASAKKVIVMLDLERAREMGLI